MFKVIMYLILFELATSVCSAGDTTRINFSSGTWREILAKSEQHHKIIFIDFYTVWCGPCINMSKEAFNNNQIGSFYNENFINYKVNAEVGEGVMLAKQFNVLAYPTLIFVNPNKQVIYRTEGYGGVDWLIKEGHKVISESVKLNRFDDNKILVEENLQDIAYLKEYLTSLAKLRQPVDSLLNAYLERLSPEQLVSEDNLAIMAGTVATTDSKAFEILLQKLPYIIDSSIGREALITLPRVIAADFKKIVETNDEDALELLITKSKKVTQYSKVSAPELIEQEALNKRIDFYRITGNYTKYHQLVNFYVETQLMSQSVDSLLEQDKAIYKQFKDRVVANDSVRRTARFIEMNDWMKHRASKNVADRLNKLVWTYYENIQNPLYLRIALGWIKHAVKLHYEPSYQNTLAHVLYKLGKKKKAIENQKLAIKKAEEMGVSANDLIFSLEKMQTNSK